MISQSFFRTILSKALKYDRPFTIQELGENVDELEEALDESGLFFCIFDNCGTRQYLSKQFFFVNSEFTIHFADYEVKNRILIAPVRFLPFTEKALPLKINGVNIPLKLKKVPFKCLEKVYSLDQGFKLIKHINDLSSHSVFSLESVSSHEIEVYDFHEIELKPGDHLKIKLLENSFEAEVFNSEQLDLREAQNWCEKFEKSLIGVLREFGPFTDLYNQLEMAFFYGGQGLRNKSSIAIRDFLSLSKKVKLSDFVFQKIIWFSENNPVNAPEVEKKLSFIHENFEKKPVVNSAFYSLLDDSLKHEFKNQSEEEADLLIHKNLVRKLQRTVRRVALWIINNKDVVADSEMPKTEILMFDAAFTEFQFLCQYFFDNDFGSDPGNNFEEALEINFEILSELMSFLKEYSLS